MRAEVERHFDVVMGRWHEQLVGPHPRWMYLFVFQPDLFAEIVPWLMRNRQGPVLLLHPSTGNHIADHTDYAVWMGEVLELDLSVLP